jgi:hypothetical protein
MFVNLASSDATAPACAYKDATKISKIASSKTVDTADDLIVPSYGTVERQRRRSRLPSSSALSHLTANRTRGSQRRPARKPLRHLGPSVAQVVYFVLVVSPREMSSFSAMDAENLRAVPADEGGIF